MKVIISQAELSALVAELVASRYPNHEYTGAGEWILERGGLFSGGGSVRLELELRPKAQKGSSRT
jgi:hypothetical protein